MLKMLADVINTATDTTKLITDLITLERLPSKSEVKTLVEAGISIYTISDITGVAVDVLQEMLDSSS